jgi:hypothetical protein
MNKDIKYGSPSNSDNINKELNQAFENIQDLFKKHNKLELKVKEQNVIQNVQNEFNQQRIIKLEQELINYKLKAENISKFNKSMYIYPTDLTPDLYGKIDNIYETASIMESSIIPISYIETSEGPFIPDDLNIAFNDGLGKTFYIENNSKNIIDNNLNTIWHREYHFNKNSNIEEISLDVIIDMPYGNISSYFFNLIKLRPYPFNAIDVLSIESYDGFRWTKLITPQLKSKNILINTETKEIKKIKIRLRQKNYMIINNEKIFYIGINDLFVGKQKINNDKATFNYILNPKETIILNDIIPEFLNNSETNKIFEYEIYKESNEGFLTQIENKFPITLESNSKTKLFFTLHNIESIPFLKKILIKYSKDV